MNGKLKLTPGDKQFLRVLKVDVDELPLVPDWGAYGAMAEHQSYLLSHIRSDDVEMAILRLELAQGDDEITKLRAENYGLRSWLSLLVVLSLIVVAFLADFMWRAM